MDVVVWLALLVLTAVFAVSLVVLLLLCRRRAQLKQLGGSRLRFSRLDGDSAQSLVQLSPLIASLLERNEWVYDVGGVLQHCVAVLKQAHQLVERLATEPLAHAPPQIQVAVSQATQRMLPRFDDLLVACASQHIDVRVLEARAAALATTAWGLYLPFTLINPKCCDLYGDPLFSMESHLETLREAVDLAERNDQSKVDVDWSRLDDAAAVAAATTALTNGGGEGGTTVMADDPSAATELTPLTESPPQHMPDSPPSHPSDPKN